VKIEFLRRVTTAPQPLSGSVIFGNFQFSILNFQFSIAAPLAILTISFLSGCGQNDIQVYRVPKEIPSAQSPAPLAAQGENQEPTLPRLQWTLPSGWEERAASAMRVASFAVAGKDKQSAEVSVIPLPTVAGHDLDLVNMWRSQVQLAAITQEEQSKQGEAVIIDGGEGKLFDMVSEKPVAERTSPLRLLVAMLSKEGTSWFFKMTGDDLLVRQQKPVFLEFLKSIKFKVPGEPVKFAKAARPVSTNVKRVPQENSDNSIWAVPPGWQEVAAGQELVAKFVIPGENGAKAELNIGQAGGGLLRNVNRWRNQLGLAPVAESELANQLRSLDVLGGKAMLVDMAGTDQKSGQKARLIGAIVSREGETWFYKLMGDEQVVAAQKETFTKFVQTVKYH